MMNTSFFLLLVFFLYPSSGFSFGAVCGNGICEEGEATVCPPCDDPTGILCPKEPCFFGTCDQDCAQPTVKPDMWFDPLTKLIYHKDLSTGVISSEDPSAMCSSFIFVSLKNIYVCQMQHDPVIFLEFHMSPSGEIYLPCWDCIVLDIYHCGDGVINGDEQCDDGNTTSGDGCSAGCTLEGGDSCLDDHTSFCCQPENRCICYPSLCIPPSSCGDGVVNSPLEQCDPPDLPPAPDPAATCNAADCSWDYCGNGALEGMEGCDDGNDSNTDACLRGCIPASCGDGHVQAGVEGCDDGNTIDGDGCTGDCRIESCPIPIQLELNHRPSSMPDNGLAVLDHTYNLHFTEVTSSTPPGGTSFVQANSITGGTIQQVRMIYNPVLDEHHLGFLRTEGATSDGVIHSDDIQAIDLQTTGLVSQPEYNLVDDCHDSIILPIPNHFNRLDMNGSGKFLLYTYYRFGQGPCWGNDSLRTSAFLFDPSWDPFIIWFRTENEVEMEPEVAWRIDEFGGFFLGDFEDFELVFDGRGPTRDLLFAHFDGFGVEIPGTRSTVIEDLYAADCLILEDVVYNAASDEFGLLFLQDHCARGNVGAQDLHFIRTTSDGTLISDQMIQEGVERSGFSVGPGKADVVDLEWNESTRSYGILASVIRDYEANYAIYADCPFPPPPGGCPPVSWARELRFLTIGIDSPDVVNNTVIEATSTTTTCLTCACNGYDLLALLSDNDTCARGDLDLEPDTSGFTLAWLNPLGADACNAALPTVRFLPVRMVYSSHQSVP